MPQQQCTNLELSQELKRLGYLQESYFWWNRLSARPDGSEHITLNAFKMDMAEENIAAPTVGELWSGLPQFLPNRDKLDGGFNGELYMGKNDPKNGEDDYTYVGYGYETFSDENLANALAKLRIYLLKNNLIKL